MVGAPKNRGRKNSVYQLDRKRYTKVPGYAGFLPRIFPFRVRCSREQAWICVQELEGEERDGYARTSHPSSTDGHVHLWLSEECAQFLIETGVLSERLVERTS